MIDIFQNSGRIGQYIKQVKKKREANIQEAIISSLACRLQKKGGKRKKETERECRLRGGKRNKDR